MANAATRGGGGARPVSELLEIFTVQQWFHSRREWISMQDMEESVQVLAQLAQLWAEA